MSGWDQRAGAAPTGGVATPARGGWDQPPRSPHGAPGGAHGHPNDRWGGPSPYQGGVAPGPELPAMAIADAIFDEIRASGTETRAPELTDRHLEVLAVVFRENHLANALELVQTGRVKRLVAERSGRSCFQVQGKSAREEYLVHPRHYCSCRAFQWDVVSRGDQLICKHQLAARIAQATGAYPVVSVTDLLMAQLLEAYMRGGDSRGGGDRRWGGGGGGGGGWGGGGGGR